MPEMLEHEIDFTAGFKILAAEDNKMNQLLLQYIFKQWQVNYTLAQNGAEAIEILKTEKFNLVLLDIQMPVMDGYSTAKWIRQELKSDVPIIAMTAFVLQAEKDKCFASGMNEYLPKPINENRLKQLLAKYLPVDNKLNSAYDAQNFINQHYLAETFGGNTEFIINILELFVKQYPADLMLLKNAAADKNVKQLKALAHNIKSTITAVNEKPPQLKNLQQLEETNAAAPDWNEVEQQLAPLLAYEKSIIAQAQEVLLNIKQPAS